MPFPAWGLFCSTEMLITGTWELANVGKPGILPTFCPFWDSKINYEERWPQLLQRAGFSCCSYHCLCCDCPCRSCLAAAAPVGNVPVLKLPLTKMLGKGTFCGISKHTHTAWESVGAPGSRWMSWGRAKWHQTKWSHHNPLCSASYFCNLVTGLSTDFHQVQDDLEIIWCLSVTGEDKKPFFFPL